MKKTILFVIYILNLSFAFGEAFEEPDRNNPVALIPFKLYGNYIIIELSVDNSDPLAFIFDTGAGGTIINSKTANIIGISGGEYVQRKGATGEAQINLSRKHAVSTDGFSLRNLNLGIVELGHLEKQIGIKIDGIIGWQILSQYAVRINYDQMQIEIYNPKKYDQKLDLSGFNVLLRGTAIFADARIVLKDGASFTGKVLIDTGAGGSIYINTPFSRDNGLLSKIGNSYEHNAKSLSTDNGIFTTGMCSGLTIGSSEFTDVPVSISSAEKGLFSSPGFMGILGNEVLKRFNLFINVKQQRISLEPNRLYPEIFEINSSGLELISDDSLRKVIVDYVYPDSPADSSGLRAGDQIIEIDGKRILPAELPLIRNILNQSGITVVLLIVREGVLLKFTLRLKRLI